METAYHILDVIDIQKSWKILDSLCEVIGIAAAIIDLKGQVIVGSRWQRICTDFHRANAQTLERCLESDTRMAAQLLQGKEIAIYQCPNGLIDAASPIIIEGMHVANAFAGQFFLKPPDRDFFIRQAARYGFNESEYLDALAEVPMVDQNRLPAILGFLKTLAQMVASTAVERLRERETTEALRESEAKLRTIIEHSNEVFYIHDTKYDLKYVSPTSEAILGYTPEEMKARWLDLIKAHPENKETSRFVRKAIETGERQAPYLLRLSKKDGTQALLEIDESPVKDQTGRVVAISGAVRDVTRQKEIEERLRKSEKGFRDLFGSISDLVYTQDLEGRFLSVNRALCDLFGYSKEELLGRPASDFMKPELRPLFAGEYLHQVKTQGHSEGVTQYYAKNGETRYIDYRSTLLTPEDGPPYISGTGRDVTEKILAEREIKRLQEQVLHAQKMEAVGLMAGGVAHDLNNILSGIVSYPDLLLIDLSPDSPLRKPIEAIKKAGMRAADVVADLLTIARGVAARKEVLNLNAIAEAYVGSLEYQRLAKAYPLVEIRWDLSPDVLPVSGSPTHIQKSLMNLVINACEAIQGGRGTISISTFNRYLEEPSKGYEDVPRGEYVVLSVSDNGVGIPPQNLPRIFEPFYTKKTMGRSGTGLGLAVVWNTVRDHAGYINVRSNEGGTVFELYFPATRAPVGSAQREAAPEGYLGHGETILVVDDEQRQREIACELLNRLGYRAEAVSSGEEAVSYLKERPVDLVVLDMLMPGGMGGRETYEAIRRIRPGQKAVIASGYAMTDEVYAAQKLGAGRYVQKPYTLENIGTAVRNELREKASPVPPAGPEGRGPALRD